MTKHLLPGLGLYCVKAPDRYHEKFCTVSYLAYHNLFAVRQTGVSECSLYDSFAVECLKVRQ